MSTAASGSSPPVPTAAGSAHGELALVVQELLTAVVRLRAGRQIAADAGSFRAHVHHLLGLADQEARALGYAPDSVRIALFAVVVFLDESVLNSTHPMFADWPRKPLQDELFGGGHHGGELFYQYLSQLMAQQDSAHLADVLEVFRLCMLLGFKGRYGASEDGERLSLIARVGERIDRIREGRSVVALWSRSSEPIGAAPADPMLRRLMLSGAVTAGVVILLWVIFAVVLGGGADELRALAGAPAAGVR